jgi:hypothetical protein
MTSFAGNIKTHKAKKFKRIYNRNMEPLHNAMKVWDETSEGSYVQLTYTSLAPLVRDESQGCQPQVIQTSVSLINGVLLFPTLCVSYAGMV